MHILVTNDDGVTAPGILALAQEMRALGKVTILAPDRNWSASGHVKTLDRPLRVKEIKLDDGTRAWACDGAPSDCVSLAANGFVEEKFDLVVSGINSYANVGHDVTYSGTVTAAMEATIWEIPAIAFSLDQPEGNTAPVDFMPAARIAQRVARAVARYGLPKNVLLNVNIPFLPADQIKGFRISRMGLRVYHDKLDRRADPRGRPYYWIIGESPTSVPERGTDTGTLAEGYVSITPLQLDLTAYQLMPEIDTWDWDSDATPTP
ncbi:MAG: 5'/3'-nucleotidase SurE [Chloroflexi bacterium]|nr:5'/3'-nucleotidase SurE [Chloroflexota bacterium]